MPTVDVLLKGGWVIDGSGGPPFRADVSVIDSVVADVGRLNGIQAGRTLDVTGLYVVPGFIDTHVHGDLMLLSDPDHLPALRQGVTTYILGQDGTAFAPASPSTMDYMRRYSAGFNGNPSNVESSWRTVDEYLARFDRTTALNVAYLIPNGNVRLEVMGHDPRPSSPDERKAMRKLVREGLEAGAVGLSTGLDYLPSRHADAQEIAELCAELVPVNGVYVTHMRGYGKSAPIGMSEVNEIVDRSGVAAHISHFNGPADLLLPLLDESRSRGRDLTFDTYPYIAGSTILAMV
ncbi:MAG TPA: amidohydrolase family protein, partial [Isosphaeraceae bacterium]|nr:amidohydrolase family protein [Isosphaeraceae bacterium]